MKVLHILVRTELTYTSLDQARLYFDDGNRSMTVDENHPNSSIYDNYIVGTRERIFVNCALGCSSNCSFCYLPKIGLQTGIPVKPALSASQLAHYLLNHSEFQSGYSGTIISLGCFTECLDPRLSPTMTQFIQMVAKQGNPIQIATKRIVTEDILSNVRPYQSWTGQISWFISCSTITHSQTWEKGTSNPQRRLSSLYLLVDHGFPTFLYIKPVIPNVTVQDISRYHHALISTEASVVLGGYYSPSGTGNSAPNAKSLRKHGWTADMYLLRKRLSEVSTVYSGSVNAVNAIRDQIGQRTVKIAGHGS